MAPPQRLLLLFLQTLLPVVSMIITFSFPVPVLSSAANVVQPDVAPVQGLSGTSSSQQQQPLVFPASQVPFSTVPAFPEQSDAAGTCPLELPDALFPAVYHSCSSVASSPDSPTARLRCCPSLAAWLYTAYASTALAVRLPSSADADLPVLPDDSESCAGSIDRAMRAKGVKMGWVNETCDVAYCYCGIKLRPLACPNGFVVAKENGNWVAKDPSAKKIERECARPGLGGCSRCLRSLRQVTTQKGADGGNTSEAAAASGDQGRLGSKKKRMEWRRERECQLMGLTWLLAKNRTMYLSTATRVLRAFMATPEGEDPVSCTRGQDGRLPLPAEFGGNSATSTSPTSTSSSSPVALRWWFLCTLPAMLWMALPVMQFR